MMMQTMVEGGWNQDGKWHNDNGDELQYFSANGGTIDDSGQPKFGPIATSSNDDNGYQRPIGTGDGNGS